MPFPLSESIVNRLEQARIDRERLDASPLIFSATARCPCGAGLAHHAESDPITGSWSCWIVLASTGLSGEHCRDVPFLNDLIRVESGSSSSTRPAMLGVPVYNRAPTFTASVVVPDGWDVVVFRVLVRTYPQAHLAVTTGYATRAVSVADKADCPQRHLIEAELESLVGRVMAHQDGSES